MSETLYELAGGAEGMQQLASAFYRRVFDDPIMVPLFVNPTADHAGRMALWLGEFFGGHKEHTEQRGGFYTVIDVHAMLTITAEQRDLWIKYMLEACEEVQLPKEVMDYFTPHIYFGAMAAQRHSRR